MFLPFWKKKWPLGRYLQENNKEGAAFVSKGQNSMRYPWTKLYFSAQLHITAALVFDVKFHSSIDIESKIGGGPGPEYRTRHQAAGWTLRCPRVPLGCNLDNLTRCWLLEFYQSPQHETRAPASIRDLKWTSGDPFHWDTMFRVLYFRIIWM